MNKDETKETVYLYNKDEDKLRTYTIEKKSEQEYSLTMDGASLGSFLNLGDAVISRNFWAKYDKKFGYVPVRNIFEEIRERGIAYASHYSDLYIPVNEVTCEIVTRRYGKNSVSVTTFINQVEGGLWYDVAFQYSPYWEKKVGK